MKKSLKTTLIVLLSIITVYLISSIIVRIVVSNYSSKYTIEDALVLESYKEEEPLNIRCLDYLENDNVKLSYWHLPGMPNSGATIYSGEALINNADLEKIRTAVLKAAEWEKKAKEQKVSIYKKIEIDDIYTEFVREISHNNGAYEDSDLKSKYYSGVIKVFFNSSDNGKECKVEFCAYAKNKKQAIYSIKFNDIERLAKFLETENITKLENRNKKERELMQIKRQKNQEQIEKDKASSNLFN